MLSNTGYKARDSPTFGGITWNNQGLRIMPGSTGWGYHQQSGLNCTGVRTIMRTAGLP
jgi:hypothetical protein